MVAERIDGSTGRLFQHTDKFADAISFPDIVFERQRARLGLLNAAFSASGS